VVWPALQQDPDALRLLLRVPVPCGLPGSAARNQRYDLPPSHEDGRRYKSMKRHLAGRGLTPGSTGQKGASA
jgi:hypothetical protein